MAVSVIPALIDAIVAGASAALAGTVVVSDGFYVGSDPGNFLMIGVDDPDSDGPTSSGSSQQDWANANYTARDESGDITCAALSWNGDGSQKAARDSAFATAETVATLVRANPSLGIANLLWTSYGTSTQLTQDQDDDGAKALIVFTVHFRARI